MSIIRNRELSQFGSFIYIDNASQEIGIATESTPYVGIGTANPTVKFHVVGDTNLEGNVNVINGSVNASSYNINGNPLVDATILQWNYASNGTDMYYLPGNIGIGTSVISQKLTVDGNVSASQFVSTIPAGTAPLVVNSTSQVFNLNASLLAGKTPPDGDIVGSTDTQTLTNKTLTNPVISSISNSGTLTLPTGDGTLIRTGSVGLVTSGMISDLSIINADVATNAGITYSKLNLSNSITNSDIVSGAGITYGKLSLTGSITNADIASNASISTSKLSAFTISGTPLGSNLPALSFGTYLTGTSYNGSAAVTIATNATSSNTTGTIVARDSSGNFTAGTITATSFVGNGSGLTGVGVQVSNDIATNSTFYPLLTQTTSGTVTASKVSTSKLSFNPFTGNFSATQFTSLSDISEKTNIKTIENSIQTIQSLRGVSFDWKQSEKGSYGVIAQEIEKILPELVEGTETKSVNYNGLIGVLIEAVKELSAEVQELKSQLNN